MHCQSCNSENREGARFCIQCGTPLGLVCGGCKTPLPAGARFCDACGIPVARDASPPGGPRSTPESYTPAHLAREILRSRHALEGERKQVTVMFADIKGSTELIDGLDPEEAVGLMQPTLRAMMDSVHRYEGTVNRVQGDGIMALFGAPIAHEDHALRACHAALAIQASGADAGRLPVRIGLNTGEVVVRSINNDLTVEYEADGPTVHLAARMEQMADPGAILLTADTYRLAQGFVMVDALGPRPVKGMTRDVPVFALRGVRSDRTRMEARSGGSLTPFVGRESELAALERALSRAADHRGQVVAISGEAGVGKSRLVREFADRARDAGWTVRITGGDPLAATTSYQPVVDLFTSLFDIDVEDDTRRVAAKVTQAVLALDQALVTIVPALHALMGASVEDPAWLALSPEDRRRCTMDAISTLTLRRAEALRLLLVFEDLHWVDAETRAMLDTLVDNLGGSGMMLLVSHRPDYQAAWGGKSYYTRVRVDPLEALTADEFLDRLLGRDASLAPLRQLLVERTEGIPFFLEESIRALAETGHLVGEAGAYRLAGTAGDLEVPATVQAVLAARIDRLPPAQKEVLQVAAVIGRHVTLSVLELVAATGPGDLGESLAELQKAEFLYLTASQPEAVYAFKHALTQEVAYASLLHGIRRRIHERLVGVIETRYAARLDEQLAVLGRHALEAEQWEKAEAYLARAAERATERCAYYELVRLLDQQLLALGHLPRNRDTVERILAVHLSLRSAHGATGDVGKMIQHLRAARPLAAELGDELRMAHLEFLTSSVVDLYEDVDRQLETVRAAGVVAREAGDEAMARLSTMTVSMFCACTGRYEDGARTSREPLDDGGGAIRHERFGMTGTWTVQVLALHAINRSHQGRFAEARRAAAECVRIAEETERPFDQGIAYWTLGAVGLWSGELDGTVEALERGRDLCASKSVGILMPNLAPTLAYALCLAGRDAEAREALAPWLVRDDNAATFWFHVWGAAFPGLAALSLGEHEGALRSLEHWQGLVLKHGLRGIRPAVERALAMCRFESGAGTADDVARDLAAALALAQAMGGEPEVALCRMDLGRIALAQGRRHEGVAAIGEARDCFRELGMPYWEQVAERALDGAR